MVLKENSVNLDRIDFEYIKKSLDYIKSRTFRSYRDSKPLSVGESSNIQGKCDYILEVIDAIELLRDGFGE